MAFVPISDTLLMEVRNLGYSRLNQELSSLGPVHSLITPDIDAEISKGVVAELEAPYKEAINVLDLAGIDHRVKLGAMVQIVVRRTWQPDGNETITRTYEVRASKLALSKNRGYDLMAERTIQIAGAPFIPAMEERLVALNEAQTRWSKTISQVQDFLRSAKSLNHAVKLWPDLRHHLPKHYLDRLDKKTQAQADKDEREKAALEALKKVDLDGAMAAVAIHRMTAGSD